MKKKKKKKKKMSNYMKKMKGIVIHYIMNTHFSYLDMGFYYQKMQFMN
eukprot:CAMPEP_0117425228 /NCGR_PEP_ID=MMETSP0758-20121206/5531_1 /TAXON_ID=63605 /ORGANISM="Percolomonas cosmopolitus, Strain AE-1 (ATCC 50343)" /LENGTH=47 /DNA_ID= /DNA_START= /DNA_END= /DNA_ORIENTATION=